MDAYNFAYLDEQTKRMIRRAILKAVAIPGYQVPFAERVRREADIHTWAVGLITEARQANFPTYQPSTAPAGAYT